MKNRLGTAAILLLIYGSSSHCCLGAKCTICKGTDSVGSPNKMLDLAEVGSFRCGDLNDVLVSWFPQDDASTSSECQWIQSLGSLCDCPREPRPDACDICPFSMGFPKRPLPFLKESLGGGILTPTCEVTHAYLLSSADRSDEAVCGGLEWIVSDYCGCGLINTEWHPSCSLCPSSQHRTKPPSKDNILDRDSHENNSRTNIVTKPDRLLNIPGFPFGTCGDLEEAVQLVFIEDSDQCSGLQQFLGIYCGCSIENNSNHAPCHLCPDGTSPITFPDKEIPFLSHALFSDSFVPTCAMVESLALSLDADSETCGILQLGSASICGCPPREEGHCEMCPGFEGDFPPPEYKDAGLPILDHIFPGDFVPTCGMAAWFPYQLAPDDDFCHLLQARSDLCGCHDGQFSYNGADTHTKRALVTWLPRATALFGIMGSLAIIVDVIATPARRKRVYNQLVLLMSIFDLMNAAGFSLTTYPTPTHDEYGNDWKVYGSHGTDASCKAQAFSLEFGGMTSIFFNASLATYYVCVFVLGWKDRGRESRRVWIWFLVLPIAAGLALSLIALPYYGNILFMCHVLPPTLADSKQPLLWFVAIPAVLCLLWGTAMMIVVYASLRRGTFIGGGVLRPRRESRHHCHRVSEQEEQRGEEDDFWRNQERIRRIKREVFWQCLFYMVAFYLTWPVWLYQVLTVGTPAFPEGFGYSILSVTVSPLQGFLNAIVYFRPRYWRYFQKRRRLRKQEHNQEEEVESCANRQSMETTLVANTDESQDKKQNVPLWNRNEWNTQDESATTMCTQPTHDAGEDAHHDNETGSFDDLDGRIEPSAIIACDISAELEELRHAQEPNNHAPLPTHGETIAALALAATMASIPNHHDAAYMEREISTDQERCLFLGYPQDTNNPNKEQENRD